VDLVIRALPALVANHPQLKYVVIGDGEDRVRLEELAQSAGVGAHVSFLGHVPEETLKEEFSRCTVFVMPSAKEGFGMVFVEAMAYGKPVVAARAAGATEVVEHGRTGMLVEYGDVAGLTTALDELLGNPELRRRLGEAGHLATQGKFSFESYCDNWFAVCEDLEPRPARVAASAGATS
jgi:glycosyltransferase involved in cell wall biosynthesis